MPIDLDNLFLIYCICGVHFNLSSIITPKNCVLLTRPGTIHLTHDSIRFDYYTCNSIRFHTIRFDYIFLNF